MGQGKFPLSRKENIVTQELDGEILVYNLETNKAVCMNETSALVWSLCDGKKSVGEISQTIAKKMNATANEDLVWLAIDQLKDENLMVNSEINSPFEGINRREVIKKVGLGTMIALPIVTGLIAPTAANAASSGQRVSGTGTSSGTAIADAQSKCASGQRVAGSEDFGGGATTCQTVPNCNVTITCR